jgi:hypothetical protein
VRRTNKIMILKKIGLGIAVAICLLQLSCGKQTDNFSTASISSLLPLKVGNVFWYRLDSTVVTNFGAQLVTKSYIAKDSVVNTFTDNIGRKAFTLFRYLTDTLQLQPYTYNATYVYFIDSNKIEWLNDNLKFIVLANPLSTNTSWKGNAFIQPRNITTNTRYADWDYTYTAIDADFTTRKGIIKNTTTVLQIADSTAPIFNPNVLYGKTYSAEVYAKGIGLVYKDFMNYFYQTTPTRNYEAGSFGIKLNLIDYK